MNPFTTNIVKLISKKRIAKTILNRNLDNLRRKYMKLTKEELVKRLILAEEYIAENNTKWVSNYFESFK